MKSGGMRKVGEAWGRMKEDWSFGNGMEEEDFIGDCLSNSPLDGSFSSFLGEYEGGKNSASCCSIFGECLLIEGWICSILKEEGGNVV